MRTAERRISRAPNSNARSAWPPRVHTAAYLQASGGGDITFSTALGIDDGIDDGDDAFHVSHLTGREVGHSLYSDAQISQC